VRGRRVVPPPRRDAVRAAGGSPARDRREVLGRVAAGQVRRVAKKFSSACPCG
jgi:hypothetical protein